MLYRLKLVLRKWKKTITPTILLLTFLVGYVGYMQIKLNHAKYREDKIIYSIAKDVELENQRDIKNHATQIKEKIDTYRGTNDLAVDATVLAFYDKAYELASNGDYDYYIFESLAENTLQMYALGYKDGKKFSNRHDSTF